MNSILVPFLAFVPLGLTAWLGIPAWLGVRFVEKTTVRACAFACALGFALSLLAAVGFFLGGMEPELVHLGTWFQVGHYEFEASLLLDGLSLALTVVAYALLGIIVSFASRYLHRERGHFRFYLLMSVFASGVLLVVLSAGLDTLFIGWELVGLSSALLIAFFHERQMPVQNALRAFITYRVCDAGLLGAMVWLHHLGQSVDFIPNETTKIWGLAAPPGAANVALIGGMLIWGSLGKGAQVPVGGWLPRAMEGPTPSSAIFYGALSVHLSPYLLIRIAPLIHASSLLSILVIAIGLTTALHATFVGRAQADVKTVLAHATMAQIGLIFVEIGAGLVTLPILHMVAHSAQRTLQILRAPNVLAEYSQLENAMGRVVPHPGGHFERLLSKSTRRWLYRLALERGYFDTFLQFAVVGGFVRILRNIDRVDRRFVAWLSGEKNPSTLISASSAKQNELASEGRS
jgi:NADH-quinone oxidoreductase subunit L